MLLLCNWKFQFKGLVYHKIDRKMNFLIRIFYKICFISIHLYLPKRVSKRFYYIFLIYYQKIFIFLTYLLLIKNILKYTSTLLEKKVSLKVRYNLFGLPFLKYLKPKNIQLHNIMLFKVTIKFQFYVLKKIWNQVFFPLAIFNMDHNKKNWCWNINKHLKVALIWNLYCNLY